MEKIKVYIDWMDKNYGATVDESVPGSVVATDKTFEGIKEAIASALSFHIEGMIKDGDDVPSWLANGDYTFEYILSVSALLQKIEKFTSLAAVSRVSGINEQLLSHYATGLKKPRDKQRERIISGIHKIGEEFLSVV
jgi:predicted RNase H-like HicB family nuclease